MTSAATCMRLNRRPNAAGRPEPECFSEPEQDRPLCRFSGIQINTPKGIRTPVASVKGRCPRPLDDGGEAVLEELSVLPITKQNYGSASPSVKTA